MCAPVTFTCGLAAGTVASSRAGRRCLTAIGVTACLLLPADNEKTASLI